MSILSNSDFRQFQSVRHRRHSPGRMRYRDLILLRNSCGLCRKPFSPTDRPYFSLLHKSRVCAPCYHSQQHRVWRHSIVAFSPYTVNHGRTTLIHLDADCLARIARFLPNDRDRFNLARTCRSLYKDLWVDQVLNVPDRIASLRLTGASHAKVFIAWDLSRPPACVACGTPVAPGRRRPDYVPLLRRLVTTYDGHDVCRRCFREDDVFGCVARRSDARAEFLLEDEEVERAVVEVPWPMTGRDRDAAVGRGETPVRRRRMYCRRTLKSMAYAKHVSRREELEEAMEAASERRNNPKRKRVDFGSPPER